MDRADLATLAVVAAVAVGAPLLCDAVRSARLPSVVVEIALGIVVGPQVLGLAELSPTVLSFSDLGLAFLMFLAGYEVDFARVRGRPLGLAVAGWAVSAAVALVVAGILELSGTTVALLYVALALTTTALGTLLPILRDSGELDTPFGSHVLATGAAGEFLPIVAVALVLSGSRPGRTTALLAGFTIVAVVAAALATRSTAPAVVALVRRHVEASSQLPVRVAVLLIVGLVWLASEFGLDTLLGAFAAGIVARLANRGPDAETVRTKLDAVGFGYFVPVFFVVSGMQFDLDALLGDRSELVRLPLFLGLFLLVRGAPALVLYRRDLPRPDRPTLALYAATALPLVVVVTRLGVDAGHMRPANAAALVGAGMCSVMLFPQLAGARRRRWRAVGGPDPDRARGGGFADEPPAGEVVPEG